MYFSDGPMCAVSYRRNIVVSDVVLVEAALGSEVLTQATSLVLFTHISVFLFFPFSYSLFLHLISVPIVLVHRYMQGDPLDRLMLYTSLWGIHK